MNKTGTVRLLQCRQVGKRPPFMTVTSCGHLSVQRVVRHRVDAGLRDDIARREISPITAARSIEDQRELALGVLRQRPDGKWVWKMDPIPLSSGRNANRVALA